MHCAGLTKIMIMKSIFSAQNKNKFFTLIAFCFISSVSLVNADSDYNSEHSNESGVEHALDDAYWAEQAQDYPAFVIPKTLQRAAQRPSNQDGSWGPVIQWPHIPVTAANLPDGRILSFSSNQRTGFPAGPEFSYAATWNPATNNFVENNHDSHDMFCGHLSILEDGRIFINGGRNHVKTTSIFDYRTNTWQKIDDMNRGRWYPTTVALPTGSVLSAIGSSGGQYPELWTEGEGWKSLTGASLQDPILSYTQFFERNWWPLLHVDPRGNIFHSGPTPKMHSINTSGLGSVTKVGPENHDWYPKHGTTVMFDEGKLLVAGGAKSGSNTGSTNKVMVIDITGDEPQVTQVAAMTYSRKFQNGVMLPTGEVLVVGGNSSGKKFNDTGTILPTEIWNPESQTWRTIDSISVPRNYHSIALLLTDGRVLSAGGGLCGSCAANHQDGQVLTPPYLYNSDGSLATRPVISNAPNTIKNGQTFSLQSDTDISKFSMIKMSATTHAVNTDLRYVKVPFIHDGNGRYELTVHNNINVLTPGFWMLFAVNSDGVPSVSKVIQVITNGLPNIAQPANQVGVVGQSISLSIDATDSNGDTLTYSATGLPLGLTINQSTGLISGQLTNTGNYSTKVTVSDSDSNVEVQFNWVVYTPGSTPGVSYEYYQGSWTKLPEFDLLSPVSTGVTSGFDISPRSVNERFGFRFSAIININQAGNYTFFTSSDDGSRLWIDGNLVVDNDGLHGIEERSGSINLTEGQHSIVVGFFEQGGGESLTVQYSSATFSKRQIPASMLFQNPQNNIAPEIINPGDQISSVNSVTSLNIIATDANDDTLNFTASGLPTGLTINSSTGKMSGTATTAGNFNITVTVNDGQGESNSVTFEWDVIAPISIAPIESGPKQEGTSVNYTAVVSGGSSLRYKWNFGDGSLTTSYSGNASISHSFNRADTYVVTLFVQDGNDEALESQFIQAIYAPTTGLKPTHSTSIAFEVASGNNRVWNVNPDNNTATAFDAEMHAKLAEITVGNAPHTLAFAPNGRLWVVNKDSATVSIINTDSLAVTNTINLKKGSQPYGLAFSPTGNYAYIALEASGELLRLNPSNGSVISSLNIGSRPRHVSVNSTGSKVYVSRFVTPRLPDEDTANPKTTLNGQNYGGEVVVVNSGSFSISNTIILKHSDRQDAEHSARGIPNYLGPVVISPDGTSAWVPSKQDNIKRGVLRDGNQLTHDSAVRSISSKINLSNESEITVARVDHDNGGIASNAIFSTTGNYLFVALEGSREIAVIDGYSNEEFYRFSVGRAPQGLAMSPDGLTLYTHNFMDRNITVHDISNIVNSMTTIVPQISVYETVGNEQLSQNVLNGKQLFYDAKDQRLALEQYVSCASCHNDGDTDGRVWDFTGFGEGLRNTIGLIGHGGTAQGPLHWSANFDEVQDFEGQIRDFAGGTGLMSDGNFHSGTRSQPLGDAKAGLNQDLDDLAAYVSSLDKVPVSPFRNSNGSLTASALQGQQVFSSKGCDSCHSGLHFTDSAPGNLQNIGTIRNSSGSRLNNTLNGIDTPTLRGLWVTTPYLHNGSASTIAEAIQAHNNVNVSSTELTHLVNYLQQLDGSVSVATGISNNVNVGQITVDGLDEDWAGLTAYSSDPDDVSGTNNPIDINNITLAHDDQKLYVRYSNHGNVDPTQSSGSYISWGWQLYLDTDRNSSTGYKVGTVGADYILEGNQLMRYNGTGDSWDWTSITGGDSRYKDNIAEVSIGRSFLSNPDAINFVFMGANEAYGGSVTELYPDSLNSNQADEQYFEYSFVGSITPPQGRPIAQSQSLVIQQGDFADITLTGSDPENSPLTFTVITNPSRGSFTGNAPNLRYTPDSGFSGSDSFLFVANDGSENSLVATVSIQVRETQTGIISNPVINIDIDANASDWAGLTRFDSDPQDINGIGEIIDWQNIAAAHNTSNLYLLYKNRNVIESGSGSYIPWGWQAYIDVDDNASTGYQIASIGADYIVEGNQLQRYVGTGTDWQLAAPTSLESWYDGDLIEIAIPRNEITNPSKVRLVFVGNNEAYEGTQSDYYPDASSGVDYLEYALSSTAQSANRPTAASESLIVIQGTSVSLDLRVVNRRFNQLNYKVVTQPSHGVASITSSGITYKPSQGYIGTDSFRYVVNNMILDSSIGTIQVNVKANEVSTSEPAQENESKAGGSLPLSFLLMIVFLLANRRLYPNGFAKH